jgi:hypothetical protein
MSSFESFVHTVESLCAGRIETITQSIDGYQIAIASLPHGYYLYGKLPINWDGKETSLARYLRLSMTGFNDFFSSLAIGRNSNDLFLSQYLAKPQSVDSLLEQTESLVNLLDVWVDMSKEKKNTGIAI